MYISKIIAMYFSPNASTKEIVKKIANSIGDYEVEEVDMNSMEVRNRKKEFKSDELLIIGFPVYSDRLPAISREIFENIKGNNTPAIAIVTYGNRDYGDALLELTDRLKEVDMRIVSATATVGHHCLNRNIAIGRPDKIDDANILEYGKEIGEKIEGLKIEEFKDVKVKGEFPYKPLKAQRTPQGDHRCIQCGDCYINCPVDAIDKEDYRITNPNLCIFCGHCINICPTNARDIKEKDFINGMKKLEEIAGERREIEIFIG